MDACTVCTRAHASVLENMYSGFSETGLRVDRFFCCTLISVAYESADGTPMLSHLTKCNRTIVIHF